jgi:threonine/homoserine/homoserine lactone efflux protein
VPTPTRTGLFCIAAVALLIVPGPSVLYIVTRSVEHGRRAGLVSVLGIHLGTLAHVTAAVVGLSALLVQSAIAFTVVKWAGAAYLVFLGLRRILGGDPAIEDLDPDRDAPLRRLFFQGAVVNILNPKTGLFFLAFLPQFVDPARGAVAMQILVFGLLFVILGLCSDGTYALVAARLGRWLRTTNAYRRFDRFLAGGVFVALGVTAALAGSKSTE